MSNIEGFLSAAEIAELLSITVTTVHAHRRRGILPEPAIRIGTSYLWHAEEVFEYATSRRKPGRPRVARIEPNHAGKERGNTKKSLGAFYTPEKVADILADWILGSKPRSVLEPSVGDGACVRALLNRNQSRDTLVTYDIDPIAARETQDRLGISVKAQDFLSSQFEIVDAAIGNPPFVRLRTLPQRQREYALATASQCLQKPLPSSASLWVPFILESSRRIRKGGRIAFVVPWEISHVRYARDLWNYLAENFGTIKLIRFRKRLFPEISQDVALLLCAQKGECTREVEFQTFETTEQYFQHKNLTYAHIDINRIACGERVFQPYLVSDSVRDLVMQLLDLHCVNLEKYARFSIGYVSGNKDYFHPSREIVQEFQIPSSSLHPCLLNGKSLGGAGLYTSEVAQETLQSLWMPNELEEGDLAYIRHGESIGVNLGYKARQRAPWYSVPDTKPRELVMSVFADFPRLMVNDALLPASNSLLVGRTRDPAAVIQRWYSPFTLLGLELAVHSLGGGVLVVIPGEAGKIKLFDTPASDVELAAVAELLKNGKYEEAFFCRAESIAQHIGKSELDAVCTAILDLKAWRNKG